MILSKERKKERKTPEKERHLRQWKNEKNESCLRWDLNPRHTVLQTDALPTELPRQPSWQGPNQGLTKYMHNYMYITAMVKIHIITIFTVVIYRVMKY